MDQGQRKIHKVVRRKLGLPILLANIVLFVVSGILLTAIVLLASVLALPDVTDLEKCFKTSMYSVFLCPDSPQYVKLKKISPYVLHAVIASEDGSFYSHKGFDWHEMEESFNRDLKSGHFQRGGSTLTQQLAKNAFLDKEKSLWRKLKEAYLAHAIEHRYSKDFILEKYLNVVEFGPDLYGVKSAAKFYFHKSADALNPLEAAYLAFLLPNPKLYSKSFRSGKLTPFARKMIATILKRMSSYGKLSGSAYQTALVELPNFPWTALNAEAFQGTPSYSLDAPVIPSSEDDEDVAVPEEVAVPAEVNQDHGSAEDETHNDGATGGNGQDEGSHQN